MRLFLALSRNVRNTDEFDQFIGKINADPAILVWLKSTFRKWLLSNGPATKIETVSDDSPQWAKDAAAKGDLYQIDYSAAENAARPIIDYFRHMLAEKKSFERMGFDEANKQQAEWHAELAKKAGSSVLKEDGVSVVKMFDNGYTWVKVFGEASLNREGEIMGHCVGSYYEQVRGGETFVYSLRDAKNIPHVTVEYNVHLSSIEQIKGTANTKLVPKYRPYVLDFLKTQQCKRIDLDESGLKESEVRKVITLTPKHVEKVEFKGSQLRIEYSELPRFDDTACEIAKVSGSSRGSYIKLDGNAIDFKNAPTDTIEKVFPLLEYCQVNEIAGFSLYTHPRIFGFGKDKVRHDLKGYLDTVLAITTFTQDLGSCNLIAGSRTGCLWPILDNETANAVVCTYKRVPIISLLVEDNSVSVLEVFRDASKYAADIKKWVGTRKVKFWVLSSNKQVRDLEVALTGGDKPALSGKLINHKNVASVPNLVSSFDFFGIKSETMRNIARSMDHYTSTQQIKAHFKAEQVRTSGFLYEYFSSFLILLLMTNKKLAYEYIVKSNAMSRQFEAFTVAPSSILAGAFARHSSDAQLRKAYGTIKAHMKQLMPMFENVRPLNASVLGKLARIKKRYYDA